ncbi:MAG: hypothetical protein MUD12_05255 [Spirochaetes bacterium]|nr:hypothetical protein [Spirochaetota bacterium]
MMKSMLSLALSVSLSCISFSCKSLDPKLLEQTAAFDKSVTPMRVVVNTDSIKACFPGGWRDKKEWGSELIKHNHGYRKDYPGIKWHICCSFPEQESAVRIIRNNLMFDRDSRNAYLSVLVRNVEWRRSITWLILSGVMIFIPCLMGMPAEAFTLSIDMEVYKAKGIDTEYVAFYWGYFNPDIPAYMNALITGCADLRKQIEADRENINKLIR